MGGRTEAQTSSPGSFPAMIPVIHVPGNQVALPGRHSREYQSAVRSLLGYSEERPLDRITLDVLRRSLPWVRQCVQLRDLIVSCLAEGVLPFDLFCCVTGAGLDESTKQGQFEYAILRMLSAWMQSDATPATKARSRESVRSELRALKLYSRTPYDPTIHPIPTNEVPH